MFRVAYLLLHKFASRCLFEAISSLYERCVDVVWQHAGARWPALLPICQLRRPPRFVMFLTQRRRERATDLPQVDGRVSR
jgi:hypothetical protein